MAITIPLRGPLQYPVGKAAEEYLSSIMFYVVEEVSVLDRKIDKAASRVFDVPEDEDGEPINAEDIREFDGSGLTSNKPTQKVVKYTDSVRLYLPAALQFQDGVQYENMDLGAIGAGVEAGVGAVDAFLSGGKNAITSLVDQFSGSTASSSAKLATLGAAKTFAPDEVYGGMKSKFGVSLNPNSRTLFKAPNIRQFSFSFKLVSKNRVETQQIKSIVNLFRRELYPESIGGELGDIQIGLGYKFPNKFKIQFLYDGKVMKGVPSIKNCYLTSVNTVYNQGSMAMHEDGEFLEVDITLAFTEERALTKQDIVDGY